MGKSLEETQERVRTAEGRIVEVDQKAAQANTAAGAAQQTANSASGAATAPAEIGKSADARAAGIEAANAQADLRDRVERRPRQVQARQGGAAGRRDGRARPDGAQLKADPKAVWVEIEGHTDNVGDARYNNSLGLQRAESVKRYLYEKHQVPLHKINVISYGEEKPVAPNKTRDGRAQNRRVVIKVLA